MSTCDRWNCPGHLGKFDSCRDEALYDLAIDADETTGDTDWHGHYALVILDEAEDVPNVDLGPIRVAEGAYIVETASSGAVTVLEYESPALAREAFSELDEAYGDSFGEEL